MENIESAKEFTDYQKEVSEKLDEWGKGLSEEFFRVLNHFLLRGYPENNEAGLRSFMNILGIGASFVFDSNSIQRVIRYELRGGKSSALSAIRSGHVTALAPPNIDYEIANHASEIARDCGITPIDVLEFYQAEIRPNIQLMELADMEAFEKVKAKISDKDDAPFVALGLETDAIGVVSQDQSVGSQDGIKAYNLEDIAQVHIHCRKRGVVIFLGILNVFAFFLLIKTVIGLFSMIFRFTKDNPKLVLGFIAGAGLLYLIFREEINQKIREVFGEKWKSVKSQLGLIWRDLSPYLWASLLLICERMGDTKTELKKLTNGKSENINSYRQQLQNHPMSLEKYLEQIFLTLKKPMTKKEIRIALKSVGYTPRGKNTFYYDLKKALDLNPKFFLDPYGYYSLVA